MQLTIRNFRSYREATSIDVGDFTALIGRNDVGKSTLLEALEIFFNHQIIKLDQNDPCVHGPDKCIEIACSFENPPSDLTIDAQSRTTLAREHLLAESGLLEIVKRFECGAKTAKEEVFARALHPTAADYSDLLQLKNAELKTRAKKVHVNLEEVDQRSNSDLREAIRGTAADLQLERTLVPLSKDDGKKVWDQLEGHLPSFAIFQADRPSKDDDPEVSDPMKLAVASAIKEVEPQLEEIKERVRVSVMEVATRTLEKLREMSPDLAGELQPHFKAEPKWDGFKLSLTGEDQVPINKRGSGVRRLILLNFFRAEAERRRASATCKDVIYAVEEPESSQHPDNQVMLINALLALSNADNTQVLITTHVPAVAAMVPTDAIRLIKRDNDRHPRVSAGGENVYEEAAACLGVLPDKRAKLAVYVEGPHDVTFLTAISQRYREIDGSIPDLGSDHRIAFVPTGGGNLKHWVNKQYLANAGLAEVHIYDRDDQANPKYQAHVDAVNGRENGDIAFLTSRREMENYLHPDAIVVTYGACPPFTSWCDLPALIAEQVHAASASPTSWADLPVEKKEEKASKAKKRLNSEAAPAMTSAQVLAVDGTAEIRGWLHAIRDRL